ncbi:MAG: hypothetical protein PHX10_08995, partial [Gallionellaceae bacterium]|nr:hypothetical protein [Gallionellaceae bacterium]
MSVDQPLVWWHESQDLVVTKWPPGLPVALLPLWQVPHVPAATALWENVAGVQAVVRWQLSHEAVVETWLPGLPVALLPLWQVAQVPGVTEVCENVAGTQA